MSSGKTTMPSKLTKKGYQRWEKSIRNEKSEKCLTVREAENGFIITIRNVTFEPAWKEDEKIYISVKNPLEKESPVDEKSEVKNAIDEALEEFDNFFS